jgi:hypothetical protein
MTLTNKACVELYYMKFSILSVNHSREQVLGQQDLLMNEASSNFVRFFLYLNCRFSHDAQVLKDDIYILLHMHSRP